MSDEVQINPELLYPGDIIRFDYLVLMAGSLADLAIKNVKEQIWADPRLDYQGSEETYPVDLDTGQTSHIVSIFAKVRSYRKGDRPEMQLANVPIKPLVALISAAVIAYSAAMSYRTYAIVRIASSTTMAEETKQGAINALGGGGGTSGLSAAIAAAGASVGTVILLMVLAWFLFASPATLDVSQGD